MLRLKDIGGVPSKGGDVGIEIEVEAKLTPPFIETDLWLSKKEDSLRFHGIEYVTHRPFKADENKLGKIKQLTDKLQACEVVKDSPRTSIHVHVNVTKMDILHIFNAMCAYWLFENVLTKYCGEDREGNLFCLRLKDAEAIVQFVTDGIDKYDNPFQNLGDRVRYAGLNTNAINKFGSLEVRIKGGTIDPLEIDEWSTEMHSLVSKSSLYEHPEDLFETFLRLTKHEFMSRFFSEAFVFKLMKIPGWSDMIDESAAIVCNLAYHTDWNKYHKKLTKLWLENEQPKPKRMPKNLNYLSATELNNIAGIASSSGTINWNPSPPISHQILSDDPNV